MAEKRSPKVVVNVTHVNINILALSRQNIESSGLAAVGDKRSVGLEDAVTQAKKTTLRDNIAK